MPIAREHLSHFFVSSFKKSCIFATDLVIQRRHNKYCKDN